MNIFYTHDIFSAQKYGGISRYFVELIKHIPPEHANITVFAGIYINEYIKNMPYITGIKIPSLKYTSRLRRVINSLLQNYHLSEYNNETITHQTYYYPFVPGKNVKYVITVYDMIHELLPEYFSSNSVEYLYKKQCCERADKIIAISNSTKNDLVRLFDIDPGKIDVIYLGTSLIESYLDSNDDIINKPYLLYVGLRDGYKNFNGLLRAFSKSNLLKRYFQIICFGGGPFKVEEKAAFKELGVSQLVHQTSGSDSNLANIYKHARTLICPSLYEGFGLPLLEAMSLGCPVICSNLSSLPEIVGNAGIYFDPNDIDSIQNALENSLFNDKLLKNMTEEGFKRSLKFNWDKCARETLALYQSLLS